jgi:hypothetical protein
MTTGKFFDEVWQKGDYRRGSTCQRLIPFLRKHIPEGSTVNDYGSGTGRAEPDLLTFCSKVNMVDFSGVALEGVAKALIGKRLTYCVSPLETLPTDFPVADWGICINVLMTVDPAKLEVIMHEMRRTCHNLIIEVYDMSDKRLGKEMTLIKGDARFWSDEMKKYWPVVESFPSPEHPRRYITIGRS